MPTNRPLLPRIIAGAAKGAGDLARNTIAGTAALAATPFSYAKTLLGVQLNNMYQSINPVNQMQGLLNLVQPIRGEFTRNFEAFGGGRPAQAHATAGGHGAIDLIPLLGKMDDLLKLTDQRSALMITHQQDSANSLKNIKDKQLTKDYGKDILIAHRKTNALLDSQHKLLAAQAGALSGPKQLTDNTQVVALLTDMRDTTRQQLEQVGNSVLFIGDNTSENNLKHFLRQIMKTSSLTAQELRSLNNNLLTGPSPFEALERNKDAEQIGPIGPGVLVVPDEEEEEEENNQGWLSSLFTWLSESFIGKLLTGMAGAALIGGVISAIGLVVAGLATLKVAWDSASAFLRNPEGSVEATLNELSGRGVRAEDMTRETFENSRGMSIAPIVGGIAQGIETTRLGWHQVQEGQWGRGLVNMGIGSFAASTSTMGFGAVTGQFANRSAHASLPEAPQRDAELTMHTGPNPDRISQNTPRDVQSRIDRISTTQPQTSQANGTDNRPAPVITNVNNVTNVNNGSGQGSSVVNSELSLAARARQIWFNETSFGA